MDSSLNRLRTKRVSITLPGPVAVALEQRADLEGRSMSNLIAYVLERHVDDRDVPYSGD
jgi:hypothetical protein